MSVLNNAPDVKLAIVGVSRDCFQAELTSSRLAALVEACKARGLDVFACPTVIENEIDTMTALAEAEDAECNAAVIYLGNFGPEGPLSIFAERFGGPVMACAAAEETVAVLESQRGDAFCGMLNASLNFALRSTPVHIPEVPVGLPADLAAEIEHFQLVARVLLGVAGLKIFGFGPRPHDFFACNAPIGQLYDMGVEVMENSELDLRQLVDAVNPDDSAVKDVAAEMAVELGAGNAYPDLLPKLARLEVALVRFMEANLGSRQYAAFANKCWPAFESAFGFVPCYVNSRLTGRGIPVACEVDLYGALSEYICYLATGKPVTLLDINNTVPPEMAAAIADLKGASISDLFMGFHCGNTASACMKECSMKYQLIMNRLMEDCGEPDITRGTLEGQIMASPITFFRLQGRADGAITSYIAEGHTLDVDPCTFGATGIFAIPNFGRFYRHVLIEKCYPHHGAVAFDTVGKVAFDALVQMGIEDINTPKLPGDLYPSENPFA